MDFIANMFGQQTSNSVDYISQRMNSVLDQVINSGAYELLIKYFGTLGILLCIAYWLVELLDKTMTDQFNLEGFFFGLIKVLMGFIIVNNLPALLSGMNKFVVAFNSEIFAVYNQGNTEQTHGLITQALATMSNGRSLLQSTFMKNGIASSLTEGIGGAADAVMIFIYSFILQIFLLYLSISRAIKIAYHGVLSPIIVADIFRNGTASAGFRQLKVMLALYLQSTVCLLICILLDVCISVQSNGFNTIIATLISIAILVGGLKKSEQYSRKVIGVS